MVYCTLYITLYILHIVSNSNKFYLILILFNINVGLYLSISGINDFFFDIVFGLEINKDSYDFNNRKFIKGYKKTILYSINIILNSIILIFCLFFLIFIEIPIIKNRKSFIAKGRFTKLKEKIVTNESQFDINERFTTDPLS